MTRLKLALYKGPPPSFERRVAHGMTRAVMTLRDLRPCPWSHVELVIDGLSYSSSATDVMTSGPRAGKAGGMRVKHIDFAGATASRWAVYPITRPDLLADICRLRFLERQAVSQGYDWPAGIYWALPLIRPRARADNCLEAVAQAVGHPAPSRVTFRGLVEYLGIDTQGGFFLTLRKNVLEGLSNEPS